MSLFYFFATLALIFSMFVVFSKNPMYSVISLVATFFTITVLYILLNAQFLAIVNFIVYMGAIMVLFLFVVMLLDLNDKEVFLTNKRKTLLGAFFGSFFLFILLYFLSNHISNLPGNLLNNNSDIGSVEVLGKVLYQQYLYPFEIASVLLLTAMIGAVLIAKKTT